MIAVALALTCVIPSTPPEACLAVAPAGFVLQEPTAAAKARAFGEEGSTWLTVGAGWAPDFSDENDFNLHVAWSKFLVRDVEFSLEGTAWYFDQWGDDALGAGAGMIFRWHFVNTGDWSVYADVGVGVLGSTDDVPDGGSSLNFHPRAGLGFTRRLDDSGTRLQVGLRWHHVSNARIFGDGDNPARDRVMLHGGLVFPLP